MEDNYTSSSSSYSNSSNTAVIYYTSGSGEENLATTGATFNNFIDLIGTRLDTGCKQCYQHYNGTMPRHKHFINQFTYYCAVEQRCYL